MFTNNQTVESKFAEPFRFTSVEGDASFEIEVRLNLLETRNPSIGILDELYRIDQSSLSGQGRITYLKVLEKQISFIQAWYQESIVFVAGVEASEADGIYEGFDAREREEVSAALRIAPITAQNRIDVARALAVHLPVSCTALANGEITSAQATAIAREMAPLIKAGTHPEIINRVETVAVAHSELHTPTQVRNRIKKEIATIDPQEFESRVANATDHRTVEFREERDGMATIFALLPAADAQTVMVAIDKLARVRLEEEREEFNRLRAQYETDPSMARLLDDPKSELSQSLRPSSNRIDQLRADALTALAANYLQDSKNVALSHRRPVTINLTIDLPTLLGFQENPAILQGYGPIPASVARELTEDSKWKRFITDPITGNLLDYGRETYTPPQQLVDFIIARDQVCRFPGCRQPARVCDIDHAIPWDDGGETSPANLGLLCRRHHRLKTVGGWTMESFEDGSCTWTSPHGQVIHVPPRPSGEVA